MAKYEPANFFVMRTPALPWDFIEAWGENLFVPASSSEPGEISEAVRRDLRRLRLALRETIRNPAIFGAIHLASPALSGQLAAWLEEDGNGEGDKLESAVVRYLMRMAGRATPFGLFAGQTFGQVGAQTSLQVPPAREHRLYSRLDTEVVDGLARSYATQPGIYRSLRLRPNDTLTPGDKFRMVEKLYVGTSRRFRLVDLERGPALEAILSFIGTSEGATADTLVDHLVALDANIDRAAACAFVEELVEAQVLCTPLACVVTGPEPAAHLADHLRANAHGKQAAAVLDGIFLSLRALDRDGPATLPRRHADIVRSLEKLPVQADPSRILHVELGKPGNITLSHAIVREIGQGIDLLIRLRRDTQSPLVQFAGDFTARYQGRSVPLLEALDEETGVAFDGSSHSEAEPSPLIDGLEFSRRSRRVSAWSSFDEILLGWLGNSLGQGRREIVLSDAQLDELPAPQRDWTPVGLAAIVSLAAVSSSHLAAGNYLLFMRSVFGRTSTALLTRFCHGDPQLLRNVRDLVKREEALEPGVLHAEVAHIPQGRAGNILARPVLRSAEIGLFGASGAPRDSVIGLGDLMVSVDEGAIRLHSISPDRPVRPHLSCAHEYRGKGFAAYRFLAALADGHSPDIGFSWGPLASAPFLPRLVYKRFVLSLARWNVPGKRFGRLRKRASIIDRFADVQALRSELGLPRFVWLREGDNTLPVDLDNILSVESLLDATRNMATVALTEVFPEAAGHVAQGEQGRFHHELVVPFVRRERSATPPVRTGARMRGSGGPGGAVHPGGNWLFVKLYGSAATIDTLISETLFSLMPRLRGDGAVERWFFVRYADPDWHLRIRIRGHPTRLWSEVLPGIAQDVSRLQGRIYRTTIDTYLPETSRYGGQQGLAHCERLFDADSEATSSILNMVRNDPEARWSAALLGMDRLLDDFGLPTESKLSLVSACWNRLLLKYSSDPLRGQLSLKARKYREMREALLASPPETVLQALQPLERRSRKIKSDIEGLFGLERSGALERPLTAIMESVLHMNVNRMSRTLPNAHELVLYDWLKRHYERQLFTTARGESGSTSPKAIPGKV